MDQQSSNSEAPEMNVTNTTSDVPSPDNCNGVKEKSRVLRAAEVEMPSVEVNYLDALMNTDPRVSFDSLHFGLLDLMNGDVEITKAGSADFVVAPDNAVMERGKEGLPVVLRHRVAKKTLGTAGEQRVPYLMVHPLHQRIAKRPAFHIKQKEVSEAEFIPYKRLLKFLGPDIRHYLKQSSSRSRRPRSTSQDSDLEDE